jgi:peptide/nickel transport system substrate-binding protein
MIRRRSLLRTATSAAGLALGPNLLGGAGTRAAETPRRGGSLRIGMLGSASDSLDAAAYVTGADHLRAQQLYDSLAETDEQFNVRLALAEEMTAETPTQWLVRLREGLVFHDGKPVTAEDVLFSIARITDPKAPQQGAQGINMIDLASSKALDQRTARLVLKTPNAFLTEEFTQIWSPIVPVGYDPKTAIGTGPFKLKSFTPGRESVFVRNEHYWREAPYLDQLVIIDFTDETARVNALLGRQIDVLPQLSPGQVRVIKATPGLSVYAMPSGNWEPLCVRCDTAPFNDVRVRQALRLIADREQIAKQVYGGLARPGNDLFCGMDVDYATELPQRHQDLDQAKSLLRAAGRSDLELEIVTADITSTLVASAQVYAQQAAAAGIKVGVRKVDPASFYGTDFLKRPFTQDSWGNFPLVPVMSLTILPGAGDNETSWYDSRTDKLIAEARASSDKGKRGEILHDIQKILYDEGGYIIPVLHDDVIAHANKVAGFPRGGAGRTDFNFQYRTVWLTA